MNVSFGALMDVGGSTESDPSARLNLGDHDPIQLFKKRLIEERVLTEEQFTEISDAAKVEAEASAQFAEESPVPSDASIFEDVYFEVDRQTEAGRTGKHFFND